MVLGGAGEGLVLKLFRGLSCVFSLYFLFCFFFYGGLGGVSCVCVCACVFNKLHIAA